VGTAAPSVFADAENANKTNSPMITDVLTVGGQQFALPLREVCSMRQHDVNELIDLLLVLVAAWWC